MVAQHQLLHEKLKTMNRILYLTIVLAMLFPVVVNGADNKQERNFVSQGNVLYRQKRYAEAETMYKKALSFSPNSEVARFNLASALIRQAGSTDANNGNTPLSDAMQLLTDLEANAQNMQIVEKAAYDLGNLAFNQQNYQGAIDHYKNALRKNPDNDKARENLRLAQKKLEEQNKNQDKNKDQQNKDQNKDQDQQNKNQDQNKDKKDDNKDKQQPDQPKDQKKDQKNQQPKPQNGGISDENAKKILKAMENAEAATRKKVEARKQKADNARRRQVTHPW